MPEPEPNSVKGPHPEVKGIVRPFVIPPWEGVFVRTHFPNSRGESEIRTGHRGRTIVIPVVIYDGYDQPADLWKFLQKLDEAIGEHGKLTITTPSERPALENCTFEGFTAAAGIRPDVAETLDGGWWVEGTLQYRQLAPKKS